MAVIPGGSHPVPDGAKQSGADLALVQNLTEDDVRNNIKGQALLPWESAHGSFFTNIIGGLGNAIMAGINGISNSIGSWASSFFSAGEQVKQTNDGMLDLANRTDLLEGVRGFCMAYQTFNVNAEWGLLGGNTRLMPFRGSYGPTKGAHIEGDGITLDEPGAWRIDSMVRANNTGYGGGDGTLMDILVYRPDGSEYVRRRFNAWTGQGKESIYGGFPLVVDGPGYYIRVETWTSRWRWWAGGTMYTFLSAVKYDNRSINPGESTVPDETQ